MVKGMTRLNAISENVAGDQWYVEKHVKELSDVYMEMFRAAGSMFDGSSTCSRQLEVEGQEAEATCS